MEADLRFREKIPVAILGATGSVGQRFIELLSFHPWFEIVAIAASEKSVGKRYKDAVCWLMKKPIPDFIGEMELQACQPGLPCDLVFSGLDSSVAGEIETAFAEAGSIVISNSSNHRMDAEVPLLVPEVNGDHIRMLSKRNEKKKGFIVTNPNCSVTGLVMALKPLVNEFGIEAVHVVTLNSISGAGYPGVPSLEILDNVIPFISGEEPKVETETKKILGKYDNGFQYYPCKISAQCTRVPVTNGHMGCVSIKLKGQASEKEIIDSWRNFRGEPQDLELPSAPLHPIVYFEEEKYPQPRLHRCMEKGMAVSIGRLRRCPLLDYKFVLLSHNTIRGAAGCAILNAELLVKHNLVYW